MNNKLPQQVSWIHSITLTPPTLGNNGADADRLIQALKADLRTDQVRIDLPLVQKLPSLFRASLWKIQCVLFKDRYGYILIDANSADNTLPVAGMAVDLGTTRVMLRLLNLATGKTLGEAAFDNPQAVIGPDILARIHHADIAEGLNELHRLIVDDINRHTSRLCKNCGIPTDSVHAMSVAGNTAMTHLFLGLSPRWIIREPYIPAINAPPVIRAKELGLLLAPQARVLVFPNVGSYFGGDLIAGILYSGVHNRDEISLLVDVGTNAEVLLGNRQWLMACAGAAGPALEGGAARMGMPAVPVPSTEFGFYPTPSSLKSTPSRKNPPKAFVGPASSIWPHNFLLRG